MASWFRGACRPRERAGAVLIGQGGGWVKWGWTDAYEALVAVALDCRGLGLRARRAMGCRFVLFPPPQLRFLRDDLLANGTRLVPAETAIRISRWTAVRGDGGRSRWVGMRPPLPLPPPSAGEDRGRGNGGGTVHPGWRLRPLTRPHGGAGGNHWPSHYKGYLAIVAALTWRLRGCEEYQRDSNRIDVRQTSKPSNTSADWRAGWLAGDSRRCCPFTPKIRLVASRPPAAVEKRHYGALPSRVQVSRDYE